MWVNYFASIRNDVGVENLAMARWWDSNTESYNS